MKNRIMLAIPALLLLSGTLLAENNFKTFSTQGHPQAKGIHFLISYPDNWAAQDIDIPDAVQQFSIKEKRELKTVSIIVESIPLEWYPGLNEAEIKKLFNPFGMKSMLPQGATFLDAQESKVAGRPAGRLEYSMREGEAGLFFDMQIIKHVFVHHSKMVSIDCEVWSGTTSLSQDDISKRMEQFRPLCNLMVNSIVIQRSVKR